MSRDAMREAFSAKHPELAAIDEYARSGDDPPLDVFRRQVTVIIAEYVEAAVRPGESVEDLVTRLKREAVEGTERSSSHA